MKVTIKAIALAAALALPAVSFGQSSNGPLTREQVRSQLIELEHAGYNPGRADNVHYPRDIQAAQGRVAAPGGMTGAGTGIGGATSLAASGQPMGQSAGQPIGRRNWHAMYGHH